MFFFIIKYLFICRHLRDRHCTREGGSYVCRYGYNGVCSSLPVEGVSDEDYEEHLYKHHVFPNHSAVRRGRKLMSQPMNNQPNVVADGQQWTVYSASQNLAGVLNDPNRGKQVSINSVLLTLFSAYKISISLYY